MVMFSVRIVDICSLVKASLTIVFFVARHLQCL